MSPNGSFILVRLNRKHVEQMYAEVIAQIDKDRSQLPMWQFYTIELKPNILINIMMYCNCIGNFVSKNHKSLVRWIVVCRLEGSSI